MHTHTGTHSSSLSHLRQSCCLNCVSLSMRHTFYTHIPHCRAPHAHNSDVFSISLSRVYAHTLFHSYKWPTWAEELDHLRVLHPEPVCHWELPLLQALQGILGYDTGAVKPYTPSLHDLICLSDRVYLPKAMHAAGRGVGSTLVGGHDWLLRSACHH